MNAYTAEQIKEHRRKWVEALRSGKFEQGHGYLKMNGRYCCLGVLSEVSGAPIGAMSTHPHTDALFWVGLAYKSGAFGEGDCCLIDLNDVDRKPFSEIADIIESEPDGLFSDLP